MARYVTRIRTSRTAGEVLAHLADLRNFAEWDPGVTEAVQVVGDGPGPDTEFDVTVKGAVGHLTLRYRTVDYVPGESVRVLARSAVFTSDDTISVVADDHGTVVTYDADLRLNGPLRLADWLLVPVFHRIGEAASAGLRDELSGVRVL
jgi:carbon monoxide dehydrogenase subunit G